MKFVKFPRTRHVEGSLLQQGDQPDIKPLGELKGQSLVVTEKLDGANSAFSFDADRRPLLQSRGEYLHIGPRERHFALMKTWVAAHADKFFTVFSDRYIVCGEWLYAKHTVFYDALPHYFMEFDIYDRKAERFLSLSARRTLLQNLPIVSVPVLHEGEVSSVAQLENLARPTPFKSPEWKTNLRVAAQKSGNREDMALDQTEDTDLAEGVYLKLEIGNYVEGRYKFVRDGFKQALEASDSHWKDRPLLPNGLVDTVDIFAEQLGFVE